MRGREVNAGSLPASSSSYSVSNPNDYLPRSVHSRFDFPTLPRMQKTERTNPNAGRTVAVAERTP